MMLITMIQKFYVLNGFDDDDDEVAVDNYWGCSIFDNLSLYYTIYKCCS